MSTEATRFHHRARRRVFCANAATTRYPPQLWGPPGGGSPRSCHGAHMAVMLTCAELLGLETPETVRQIVQIS